MSFLFRKREIKCLGRMHLEMKIKLKIHRFLTTKQCYLDAPTFLLITRHHILRQKRLRINDLNHLQVKRILLRQWITRGQLLMSHLSHDNLFKHHNGTQCIRCHHILREGQNPFEWTIKMMQRQMIFCLETTFWKVFHNSWSSKCPIAAHHLKDRKSSLKYMIWEKPCSI